MTQPRAPEQPAACAGKERMTASVAKRIAAQMRRRGANVDSFKCNACGLFRSMLGRKMVAMRGLIRKQYVCRECVNRA